MSNLSLSSLSSNSGGSEDDRKVRAISTEGWKGNNNTTSTATMMIQHHTNAITTKSTPTVAAATTAITATNGVKCSVTTNDSSSDMNMKSDSHVPESAARWIVTQLVEFAQSMSYQNQKGAPLATVFVQHSSICSPKGGASTQENANLLIESIIHRFSRPTYIYTDGLASLKLTSLRYVATKLYDFCQTERQNIRIAEYNYATLQNANVATATGAANVPAPPSVHSEQLQMYEAVLLKLSHHKTNAKQKLMERLTSCFKINDIDSKHHHQPYHFSADIKRKPNHVLIQSLLRHQQQKPAFRIATTPAVAASSSTTNSSAGTVTARVLNPVDFAMKTVAKYRVGTPQPLQRNPNCGHFITDVMNGNIGSSNGNTVSFSNRKMAPVHNTVTAAASQQPSESDTDQRNMSYDNTPQTPHEHNIVSTLRNEMNFEDSQEILFSYRKLVRKQQQDSAAAKVLVTSKPTADEVMLEIINQREEAEEAKKMDQARVLSELSRKEEAKRRRDAIQQEFQKSIESCTDIDTLMDPNDKRLFSNSWILRDPTLHDKCQRYIIKSTHTVKNHSQSDVSTAATVPPLKMQFLELLQLEKNSGKWYGPILPKSYFQHFVIERLKKSMVVTKVTTTPQKSNRTSVASPLKEKYADSDSASVVTIQDNLLKQIQFEITTLQSNIYDLSKQVGGVPKIFRDAHDQFNLSLTGFSNNCSKNSSPTTRSKALLERKRTDEDSVELVLQTPSSPSKKKIRNPYTAGNQKDKSSLPENEESINVRSTLELSKSRSKSSPKRVIQPCSDGTSPNAKKKKIESMTLSSIATTTKTDPSNTGSSGMPVIVIDLC